MRSNRFETCAFCPNTFFKYLTPHYRFHNKPICKECCSELTKSKYSVTPTLSPPPHSTTSIPSQTYEHCSLHLTLKYFYCNTCSTSLCSMCLSEHSSHQTTSLDSAYQTIEKKLTWLTRILSTHLKLNSYRPKSLEYLLKSLQSSIHSISLNFSERISKISRIINIYYSKFKRIYQEYNNLTLESAFSRTQSLIYSASLDIHNYYIWLEWGSCTIHLLDLKTNAFSTKGIRREYKIPYYSRSLTLPDGRIFISGGKLDLDTSNTYRAWILNIKTCEVKEIESMKTGRSNHCLVYLHDSIYALGGCNQYNQFTSRCERYCMLSKRWRDIPDSIYEIDSASAVAINHLNIILVFGGRQHNGTCNSAIQQFDAMRNCWTIVSIEPVLSRYLLGAILIPQEGSKILIFGGLDNSRNPSLDCYLFDYESSNLCQTGFLNECLTTISPPSLFQDYIISSEFLAFNVRHFYRYEIRNKLWVAN